MNCGTGLIAPLVQSFFTDHLVRQRRASPQTVASYRDTFRLLLKHLSQATGRKPADLTLEDLPAKAIMRFLDSVERDRGNSIQTRNARLAAIRSFFRLVTLREPARIDLAAQVLAIPVKRADRRLIGYLTRPEMDAILATPSTQTWIGKRDYALLLTLYNTGARISESLAEAGVCALDVRDGQREAGVEPLSTRGITGTTTPSDLVRVRPQVRGHAEWSNTATA